MTNFQNLGKKITHSTRKKNRIYSRVPYGRNSRRTGLVMEMVMTVMYEFRLNYDCEKKRNIISNEDKFFNYSLHRSV